MSSDLRKFENESVYAVPSTDGDGKVYETVLVGSYVIIPKSHVPTPFDLSEQEWLDTYQMLAELKAYLDERFKPDGYNLGWNVGTFAGQVVPYVHMHVIPRFKGEPFAGKGIRYLFKQTENTEKWNKPLCDLCASAPLDPQNKKREKTTKNGVQKICLMLNQTSVHTQFMR